LQNIVSKFNNRAGAHTI